MLHSALYAARWFSTYTVSIKNGVLNTESRFNTGTPYDSGDYDPNQLFGTFTTIATVAFLSVVLTKGDPNLDAVKRIQKRTDSSRRPSFHRHLLPLAMTERTDERAPAPALDELLSILAIERRRHILYYFPKTSSEIATLDDLAEHLLSHHCPTTDREQARVILHHKTLPKLDAAGIIEYESRSETVRYLGHPRLRRLVEVVETLEDRE